MPSLARRVLRLAVLLTGPSLFLSCTTPPGGDGGAGNDGGATQPLVLTGVSADVPTFVEHHRDALQLTADLSGEPRSYQWIQVAGPPVALSEQGPSAATVDVHGLSIAAPVELSFSLEVEDSEGRTTAEVTVTAWPEDMFPVLGEGVQMGGANTHSAVLSTKSGSWILFNISNRLRVTPLGRKAGAHHTLILPGAVQDIEVVRFEDRDLAMVAMGTNGIAVVDMSSPENPTLLRTVTIDYRQEGVTFAEGGGDIVADNIIEGASGEIKALLTDGATLWIADASYGLHRTSLEKLVRPDGPSLELNGTLSIEQEAWTLQYAGENPWGGPQAMTLVGNRLFVAQGFLGLGIYDATTLERVGGYNLYTDASAIEDWFVDEDVATVVQHDPKTGAPYLDAVTGMPDYRQAHFEVAEVWHGDIDAPTPWAEFDRYGKDYYNARAVDVVETTGEGEGEGERGDHATAYVAYGMGGLVAVDVTGFHEAGPGEAALTGHYLAYAPAVPANGPDSDDAYGDTNSLYPHYGSGMLKEAGVVGVKVWGNVAWYADHFAGLVALEGADDPATRWHGPRGAGRYDNDDPSLGDGVLGDHWPDYEFVTSYDMSPYDPLDNESLPTWIFEAPCLLATGEITGHGGPVQLLDGADAEAAGQIDILQATGAGGLIGLDILDLSAAAAADRYAVPVAYPTTDEIGAAADGSPTQAINIGHTAGVAVSGRYLYVGDGPHGMSAWQIAGPDGAPLDELHLVANTLQDEYPESVDGVTVYPTPHASVVAYHPVEPVAFSLSQSLGLRRVDVTAVEGGRGVVGAPVLLQPQASDLYEHNGTFGRVDSIRGQDHAYDLALDGSYAFVADGTNGLTVYDLRKDPSDMSSGFVVGNLGDTSGKPYLGRATGIDLWRDPDTAIRYAFVAAGPYGVAVVDASDPANMRLIKLFEPIKMEDDTVGKADGRCVDVHAIGDVVYYSYSSFGVVAYSAAELIAPLPEGVDPTDIWERDGPDYRPQALAQSKLTDFPGYETADFEALYMEPLLIDGQLRFYIAAGAAGVWVLDWTDPGAPALVDVADTVGEATSVALSQGRVYVADGTGGITAFR